MIDTTVRVIHTNYNSIPRITNIVASKVKQSKQNQDFELFHNYSPCRTHHPRALVQLSNMKALLPDFGVLWTIPMPFLQTNDFGWENTIASRLIDYGSDGDQIWLCIYMPTVENSGKGSRGLTWKWRLGRVYDWSVGGVELDLWMRRFGTVTFERTWGTFYYFMCTFGGWDSCFWFFCGVFGGGWFWRLFHAWFVPLLVEYPMDE